MLRSMLKDRVTLVKRDGRRFEKIRASVQTRKIFSADPKIPIEEGDVFERLLPSGITEQYIVTDPGFMQGMGSIRAHYQTTVQRVSAVEAKQEESTQMLSLFVSHSSKDLAIVCPLVELLRAGLRLSAAEILCTSVDGYRLRGGANTEEELRTEVHDARAFLGVISPASLESMYVTFELGARWGARKHLLPVLTPGTDKKVFDGPLGSINALRCDNRSQLHQLVSDLAAELGIKPELPAALEGHIEDVLQAGRTLVSQPQPSALAASPDAPTDYADPLKDKDVEFEVLVAVSKLGEQQATVSAVAASAGLSEGKAKYYLDELVQEYQLVSCVHNVIVGIPDRYQLTHKGRGYLIKRGVIE